MTDIWLSADLHFGHANSVSKWTDDDGNPYRPFASIEEADEAIIERHNALVKPTDKLYILGDLAWNAAGFKKLSRLNGQKYAVLGNHDSYAPEELRKVFRKVYGAKVIGECVLTHIPIHPDCMERWRLNIHGHLHKGCIRIQRQYVTMQSGGQIIEHIKMRGFMAPKDPGYFCVSVEQNDYKPFNLEDILAAIVQPEA